MREPRPTISLELPLYLIVFVFGTWLRLSQIDRYPLTDAEAFIRGSAEAGVLRIVQ